MAAKHLKYKEKHKVEHYGTDGVHLIKGGQATSVWKVTFGKGPKGRGSKPGRYQGKRVLGRGTACIKLCALC